MGFSIINDENYERNILLHGRRIKEIERELDYLKA
jgi:hypothetical protein